jgi:glycosyltransferase involved in cell wall biosynthesis
MKFRSKLLFAAYKIFPFSLKGDAVVDDAESEVELSCIINFFGRINLLEGILYSLAGQDLSKIRFEVILVEDQGGTQEGKACADRFKTLLNIKYHALTSSFGMMGYSRNFGLSKAKGKYILFLDDDTIILQKKFLSTLVNEFNSTSADCIIPHGRASFYQLKGKYGHLDSYFPANRCTAYRRVVLKELGGFVASIIGQEDVEFVIRFLASGRVGIQMPRLEYFHPPLLMPNFRKAKSVGNSFYRLKKRYPFLIWLLVIMNCARHAPLYLLPTRKFREMGRFGLGFLLGVIISPFKNEGFRYG